MNMKELEKELETKNKIYRGIYHDCSKQVEVSAIVTEEMEKEVGEGEK